MAELLAQKITAGEVPDFLKNKKILKVNLGELISGSKFRGEFEERVSALIQEAKKPEVLLFIDEFHNINGAGKSEGSMGFSDLLKPELSSGNLQVIGATTTEEYRKQIEKDSALSRRFENLTIPEPTNEKMLTILRQIEQSYEKHHGVIITDNALVATVELSDKYIKDRKFPDKAIAVLDQAAARVHLQMTTLPLSITQKQQEGIDLKNTLRSLQEEVDLVKNSLEKAKIQEQIDPLPAKIEALETEYTQQKENWEQLSRLYQEQNPSNAEAIQQLESVF
ncbi:MAG: AAA family ATPase [Candidatus Peribacteria bacterium]|nr:AAA family ATPase [Candidatus Peribacteria bacterium]